MSQYAHILLRALYPEQTGRQNNGRELCSRLLLNIKSDGFTPEILTTLFVLKCFIYVRFRKTKTIEKSRKS